MQTGTVLNDKYRILEEIGRGGMSVVYVALDIRLNKKWAIKEIKKDANINNEILVERLRAEADVLKRVDHPNLPRIVDIIYNRDSVLVVMDYIEGRTLSSVIEEDGPQRQEVVVGWMKSICQALDYLHNMKPPIIYRDMKPSNIMLKNDGSVRLIDFGTAKECSSDNVNDRYSLGTREYAAPEQLGEIYGQGVYKTDARTDIYSLGATMYYLLTGDKLSRTRNKNAGVESNNPGLSCGLEKIIMKCTRINPQERYRDCKELIYNLDNYKKLEDVYVKSCFRKIRGFIICVLMSIFFGITSICGYLIGKRDKERRYDLIMNQGYSYMEQGRFNAACDSYIKAITEIDGSRNEAYLRLLSLYIEGMDDIETGLSRVTYYIDCKYCGIQKDSSLLARVAMYYFEILNDYRTSVKYFNMIDTNEYPEAEYYSAIASSLSGINTDYNKILSDSSDFMAINEALPISLRKITNYRLLCAIYIKCIDQKDDVLARLEKCAIAGLETLDKCDEEEIKAEYYITFNQYLSVAYEKLGDYYRDNDREDSDVYYRKALKCCDEILALVSSEDDEADVYPQSGSIREAKYCQKAGLYEKLGQYDTAKDVYEKAGEEFGNESIPIAVGYLSLLCKQEEIKTSDMDKWNRDMLLEVYERERHIAGIEKDYRWKRLMVKLMPLFEDKGG